MTTPKPKVAEILSSWQNLQKVIADASEELCNDLFDHEMKVGKRARFALRIHSRLNRIRRIRERNEIESKLGKIDG